MSEQPIQVTVKEEIFQLRLTEEKLVISSPVATVPSGVFLGSQVEVAHIVHAIPTTLDVVRVATDMPATIKWMLLLIDQENGLVVSSEINALRQTGGTWFTEYARLGDTSIIVYDLDVTDDGNIVRLVLTSQYDGGELLAKARRIGLF